MIQVSSANPAKVANSVEFENYAEFDPGAPLCEGAGLHTWVLEVGIGCRWGLFRYIRMISLYLFGNNSSQSSINKVGLLKEFSV